MGRARGQFRRHDVPGWGDLGFDGPRLLSIPRRPIFSKRWALPRGDVVAFGIRDNVLQPLGTIGAAVAVTGGVCRSPFSLRSNENGVIQMDPPDACDGNLRLVPLATLDDSAAQLFTNAGWQGSSVIDLEDYGAYAPKRRLAARAAPAPAVADWSAGLSAAGLRRVSVLCSVRSTAPSVAPQMPRNVSELTTIFARVNDLARDLPGPDQHTSATSSTRSGCVHGW